ALGPRVSLTEFSSNGYNAEGGGPVSFANSLNCDFEGRPCCWANTPTPEDQIDWQLASGIPESQQFRNISIEGHYLVAHASSAAPSDEAQLTSCAIGCASTPIRVRARHWQSPNVLLQVCQRESFPNSVTFNPLLNCQEFPMVNGLGFTEVVLPKAAYVDIVFVASNFVNDNGDIAVLDNLEVDYQSDPSECANERPPQAPPSQPIRPGSGSHQFAVPETRLEEPGALLLVATVLLEELVLPVPEALQGLALLVVVALPEVLGPQVPEEPQDWDLVQRKAPQELLHQEQLKVSKAQQLDSKYRQLLWTNSLEFPREPKRLKAHGVGVKDGRTIVGADGSEAASGSESASSVSKSSTTINTSSQSNSQSSSQFSSQSSKTESHSLNRVETSQSSSSVRVDENNAVSSVRACQKSKCTFEAGTTCAYTDTYETESVRGLTTRFQVVKGQFMNRVTGVKESTEGEYYAATFLYPREKAGLLADVGAMPEDGRLRFQYYEGTHGVQLKGCCDSPDSCPFSSDKFVSVSDRMWKYGSFACPKGTQKLLFLCENTRTNQGACALDDIQVVENRDNITVTDKPLC
ncbi:CBN-MLT-9 protein, partial [Aphelenchoides avenae]